MQPAEVRSAPSAPPEAPAPGQRIGKFELLRLLGAGGMGAVYAARDTLTGLEVALKVLLPGSASNREQLERFKRETRVCQQLGHPGLVRVHDIGEDAGRYFLSMELLDGSDL